MSVLPIIKYPAPVLRARAKATPAPDAGLKRLARDMLETMRAANGIGLAAPQISRPLRLIVAAPEEAGAPPLVFFNPRIVFSAAETAVREEGCLSMPGISAPVRRPARVCVAGLNLDGAEYEVRAEGLLASCLQHEIDHLNGALFIDHLSRLRKGRLLAKYLKLQKDG
ncbi:MAG: peptide deformylase [Gammaproteobacteria bacterium]